MLNSRYNLLDNKNPITEILSSYSTNQIRPFNLHWLNSAHLETLLPGSNWEKIYDIIIPNFCEKISSQFLHENRKQAIFQLLGTNFVSKYFPHDSVDVSITKPPILSMEESIKLYEESGSWLDVTLERSLKENSIYDRDNNVMSTEMNDYKDQASYIFTDHFYKELAKKETEYLKSISTRKRNFRPGILPLHHKPETAVSSVHDKDLPDAVESIYPFGPEMMIAPGPHCNSFQSEFIGLSLASVCQQNENEIKKLCNLMSGRRLPVSLRKLLWKNVLHEIESPIYNRDIHEIGFDRCHLGKDASNSPNHAFMKNKYILIFLLNVHDKDFLWKHEFSGLEGVNKLLFHIYNLFYPMRNFEELVKEKFVRSITRNMSELKINKEMVTPVNELLEHLIVEQYERCLPLNKFNDDFKSEAIRILNLLYIYDRSYDRHLIFWLFPLQYGLKQDADDLPLIKTTFTYEMALFLHLFRKIYPPWPVIFEIVEQIVLRLFDWNPQFVNHLFNIAQINVVSHPKEFLAQIIDMEKRKLQNAKLTKSNTTKQQTEMQTILETLTGFDLIKSPIIFIRKWISEGFVSVLKNEAVLYIFDQLFMEKFSSKVFQSACLAIVLLLQNDFLKAQDHDSMKNVFLKAPFNLLTLDIIRTWSWIHRGGDFSAVSIMNRKEMYPCPSKSEDIVASESSGLLPLILPNVSFNEFRLKLIFPESSFLKDIKEEILFINLTLCYENTKIIQFSTKINPKRKLQTNIENNQIVSNFKFDPLDIVTFHDLDVTQFKDLFKQGNIFHLLITVHCRESNDNVLNLGWCTFQCFHEEMDSNIRKLFISDLQKPSERQMDNPLRDYIYRIQVKNTREEIPIVSDNVPENFVNFKIDDNIKFGEILSEGSMFAICSFNPDKGPPTPSQSPVTEIINEPIPEEQSKPLPPPVISIVLPETQYPSEPKSVGEPRPQDDSYVPYNQESYEKIKPPLSTKVEPFCLYIDQIRFLPDTATIIKVTGRFVQTGNDGEISDILLFPDVESSPRSPTFRPSSRIIINENRKLLLQNSSLLVLRVYTILKTNLEIVVIGNCIVPIFDLQEGILLSGCFQKRLRNQLPDVGLVNTNNLNSTSMDGAPYIDSVSVTLRLWPLTAAPIAAPDYKMGYYQSIECQPSDFEWEIFSLYKKDTSFPTDLREVVKDIKYRDNNLEYKDLSVDHAFMLTYLPIRLDITKYLPENQAPRNIQTELMFHYRIEKGIHLKVDQIFGLSNEKLLFVTTKVLRGYQTSNMEPRIGKKYGLDEFNVFSDLDPNHAMRSTKWRTPFQVIRPFYDEQALLIIQVWGIDAKLINGEFFDKISNEKIVKLSKSNYVGWTAIQLFKNTFVNTGKHQMPLYQNRIHHALLKRFQTTSISTVLQKEEEFRDLDGDSIVVYLLDGHKEVSDYPAVLPLYTEIIDELPEKKDLYIKAMNSPVQGKMIYDEISNLMKDIEIEETKGESKLTIFNKMFNELACKLSVSIPPKQPYMPIFIPNF